MDRRMYRSNMGRGRYVSPYRTTQPICSNIVEKDSECNKHRSYCEDDFKPERFPIGMCYVPWQCFRDLYENEFAAWQMEHYSKNYNMTGMEGVVSRMNISNKINFCMYYSNQLRYG